MSNAAISLEDVEQARERLRGAVRRTPCLRARFLLEPPTAHGRLLLKLECLQVSGSFKARGASNKVAALDAGALARGLITASGGNHGLGVAYAGWRAGAPVRVVLPRSTPRAKAERLRRWGARVEIAGEVWDDANARALEAAGEEGLTYVHPFADPAVMAGQGTVGLEILGQAQNVDSVLVAIGGGGLIAGIATAVKGRRPGTRVIGIEPRGAPTLSRSVAAGHCVTLDHIDTAAGTLAPRTSDPANLAIVERLVDDIVLVDDQAMRDAARWLWFEMGLSVELSAAAALAALRTGAYRPATDETVCAVVCGAGEDGVQAAA
jgi:threonine dehydratase